MNQQKVVPIDGIGEVRITKRRGQKSIRITISDDGPRVTQPYWLPFSAGEQFLKGKTNWLKSNIRIPIKYTSGQTIGKGYKLEFIETDMLTSRVGSDKIIVKYPRGTSIDSIEVQNKATKAVTRALRNEAEDYIPKRTSRLANLHGFIYKSITIRDLKRRWGSCNSKAELSFNLHLMNLADEYIDYVILHELCHTRIMNHSADFWNLMEDVYPGARQIAKIVRRSKSYLQ